MLLAGPQNELVGNETDADDLGLVGEIAGRALADPVHEDFIRETVASEANAAFVRSIAEWFGDDEARFGRLEVDASAQRVLGDEKEIRIRIGAAQRQLEPVLAERIAMTAARIAAGFREDRHHLMAKADRRFVRGQLHFYRDGLRDASDADGDLGLPVGDGTHPAFGIDRGDFRIGARVLRLRAQIEREPVRRGAEHLQCMRMPLMPQLDRGRLHGDGCGQGNGDLGVAERST